MRRICSVVLRVNTASITATVTVVVERIQASVTAVKTEVIKMLDAPYKDCTERHTACHSTCDKYKAFKQGMAEEKAKREKWEQEHDPFPSKIIGGLTRQQYLAKVQKERLIRRKTR